MTEELAKPNKIQLDIKEIEALLPHRYPFLLVDRVLELDFDAETIIAQKNVSRNEHFFQGHFPGSPIMPGVLILEALAQAGSLLYAKKEGLVDKIAVLLKIEGAKFRKPVKPGDVLLLHAQAVHFGGAGGKIKAQATVDGKLVCEAEIGFALVKKEQI